MEYVTFQPCVQSITQSRRWPGNEPISMHVIYSESEEAAASSASMLGTPVIRSSLPPPSLPLPSLPSFSLPSSRPPQMLRLFASLKAEEKKTSECSFNISSQSVWWFMRYQDSLKIWFKMEVWTVGFIVEGTHTHWHKAPLRGGGGGEWVSGGGRGGKNPLA